MTVLAEGELKNEGEEWWVEEKMVPTCGRSRCDRRA